MTSSTLRVIWEPNPGPQRRFLACPLPEILYGGAVGGGKSEVLLLDFLKGADHPQTRGLLLRRSYPELKELIQRTLELYPFLCPGARWVASRSTWYFPKGATLQMGYVGCDQDVTRYQGIAYTWIGWDELTHFSEYAYTYLSFSRARTVQRHAARHVTPTGRAASTPYNVLAHAPVSMAKVRVRATCNPGGIGHAWVKARFIDVSRPGTTYKDPQTGLERVFIAARLKDNPFLFKTDYGRRLLMLPPAEQRALLHGDWDAYTGEVFRLVPNVHIWTARQFLDFHNLPYNDHAPADLDSADFDPASLIPQNWTRYRVMDWGYARPYAVYWIAMDFEGRAYVYRELYGIEINHATRQIKANTGSREEPEAVAEKIAQIEAANDETIQNAWTGPDLHSNGRGDYGASKPIVELFERQRVFFDAWAAGPHSRVTGKMALHNRLAYEQNPTTGELVTPPGLVFLTPQSAPHAIRTIPTLVYDKNLPEQVDTKGEDHGYDALSGFAKMRPWAPVLADTQDRPEDAKPGGYYDRLYGGNADPSAPRSWQVA